MDHHRRQLPSQQPTLVTAQGNYEEAEGMLRRSLAIREKALGADHPKVATDLDNLAVLLDRKVRVDMLDVLKCLNCWPRVFVFRMCSRSAEDI